MSLINIAHDPGFGAMKTGYLNGSGPQAVVLPSVVGAGTLSHNNLSTGLETGLAPERPMQVQFMGQSYLVGANVHRETKPIERLDFDHLTDGPELRALMYASLFQALGPQEVELNLLLGMPVEVVQNRDLDSQTLSRLRGWLIGQHDFCVNNVVVSYKINQVKRMAQPMGAFFQWGADDNGQWIRSDNPAGKFAVADIGMNTFDLFVIENKQVIQRFSQGENLGTRRALSFIRQTVYERYGYKPSFYEADQLARHYTAKREAVISHMHGEHSAYPIVAQAVQECWAGVQDMIGEIWDNTRQFRRLIFTGGGAELLSNQIKRTHPTAIIMGQTANVLGLAKFAQREGVF